MRWVELKTWERDSYVPMETKEGLSLLVPKDIAETVPKEFWFALKNRNVEWIRRKLGVPGIVPSFIPHVNIMYHIEHQKTEGMQTDV